MKVLLIVFLCLTSTFCSAMEVEAILAKVRAKFSDAKSIEYNSTYQLFKGHKSTTVHTSYDGYMYRSNNSVYQKINKTEFISGKDFFLQVSHDESIVVLNKAQKLPKQDVDISSVLKGCNEKTVDLKNGYYDIVLKYQLLENVPFSVVKLKVRASDFMISQIDMYYTNSQDFSTNYKVQDLARPHLKIKFSNITTSPKERKDIVSMSKYLSVNNTTITPTGDCKNYTLIDKRIK